MLRTDYCIVLHRDFQKEQHLKKEGKVCIVLGKWEISALNILCLHIWKLHRRCNPSSNCTLTNRTCCETRAPTKRPGKPSSPPAGITWNRKPWFFFFKGLKTSWTCAYTLLFPATPAPGSWHTSCFLLLALRGARGFSQAALWETFIRNKLSWAEQDSSSSPKL